MVITASNEIKCVPATSSSVLPPLPTPFCSFLPSPSFTFVYLPYTQAEDLILIGVTYFTTRCFLISLSRLFLCEEQLQNCSCCEQRINLTSIGQKSTGTIEILTFLYPPTPQTGASKPERVQRKRL